MCILNARKKMIIEGPECLTLSKIGYSALNLVQANSLISEFDPGSWPPN